MRLTPDERQSYAAWEEFRLNMERATPAETGMTEADKKEKAEASGSQSYRVDHILFPGIRKI